MGWGPSIAAQDTLANLKVLQPSSYVPISVSYYGNMITHPGVKLAVDYPAFGFTKFKAKRRKTKEINKLIYLQPSVAYFVQPQTFSGLLLAADVGLRRYNTKLYFTDAAMGIGYMWRFNHGETWQLDDNGDGHKKNIVSSKGYFAPGLSFGFGKLWIRENKNAISVFSRINSNFLFEYSAGILIEGSLEIGVKINPSFGLKAEPIQTKVKR